MWQSKVLSAFKTVEPESLICDGSAVWLDAETKQPLEHRFKNRPTDAYKSDIAVMVDMSKPVTRERMSDFAKQFGAKNSVMIKQYRFFDRDYNLLNPEPSFDDVAYITHTKTFMYFIADDSLVIYEDGAPVYANDAGVICTDKNALADTFM